MPTGYTADIPNGITFQQYALSCARAFGATISMRDDPSDAKIPDEFKPSGHNQKQLDKALAEKKKYETMSAKALAQEEEKERQKRIKECHASIARNQATKTAYEKMLKHARAYKAPTRDHEEFKNFMETQITSSIEFDCMGSYYENQLAAIEPRTPEEYREEKLTQARKDIAYHAKAQNEENDRCAKRTAWIKALKNSLK